MAILTVIPPEWATYQRNYPPGYMPIETKDAISHPNVLKAARVFIDTNVKLNKPIGYREQNSVDGRTVIFTIEPHYHEPNGPTKPWGWHKGCSVAVEAPHYDYGPQLAGDMGVDVKAQLAAHPHVKTGLTIGGPVVIGLMFGGPIGAVLGAVGGAAFHHFHK